MEYISAMNHGRKITFFKLRKMMKNLYQSVIPQCTSRTPRVGRAVFGCCFFLVLDSFLLFFISCLVVHLVCWLLGVLRNGGVRQTRHEGTEDRLIYLHKQTQICRYILQKQVDGHTYEYPNRYNCTHICTYHLLLQIDT